tara:strand:+ start:1259 stop:2203 length:945 start_codon:yes stop_codon:yes gene_type:complete
MENWRSYLNEPQYDISPQFAAGSLGLEAPLNESYPYSSVALNKKVVNEYVAFENWFSDLWLYEAYEAGILEEGLKDKVKAWAGEKWDALKELAGAPATIMKMIWKAVKDGKANTLWKSLMRKGINPLKKRLFKFLDFVIKYREKVPTFASWAEKVKSGIEAALQKLGLVNEAFVLEPREVPKMGKIAGVTLTLIGMNFIWGKIKEMAEDVMGQTDLGGMVEALKTWAKKIALKKMGKIAGDIAAAAASVATGGIAYFGKKTVEWAQVAGDVVKAGFEVLTPVAQMFKGRGGMNEATQRAMMLEAIQRTQIVLTP